MKNVYLDAEYHREMRKYIESVDLLIQQDDFDLDTIRETHMTKLNRIQQIKNTVSYKREKHKDSHL